VNFAAVNLSPRAEKALGGLASEQLSGWIYTAVQRHMNTVDKRGAHDRVCSVHETGAGPGKVVWVWSGPESGHLGLRIQTPEEHFYGNSGEDWRN
jgi:hypothetical protein